MRLPPDLQVFERGWLSANGVLFTDAPRSQGGAGPALVDTGYASHSLQTVALVEQALGPSKALERVFNTHLHSDHCGGNAALQARYPELITAIPPGEAEAAQNWDVAQLSYQRTGQACPRFSFQKLLTANSTVTLGGRPWEVHAAPGHDNAAVLLFQPDHGCLIAGDALWENGFGVVFPELDGDNAFDEVESTLNLIEQLAPRSVIPGHGAVFYDLPSALKRARQRLAKFWENPNQHRHYAAKVLVKFKLLEWQQISEPALLQWAAQTPYFQNLHQHLQPGQSQTDWLLSLVDDLIRSGAAKREVVEAEPWLIDA